MDVVTAGTIQAYIKAILIEKFNVIDLTHAQPMCIKFSTTVDVFRLVISLEHATAEISEALRLYCVQKGEEVYIETTQSSANKANYTVHVHIRW